MKVLKRLAGLGLALASALFTYSFFVEPRWLEISRERIHVRNLHPDLEGFRIGLMTDMHAKPGRTMELVRRGCRVLLSEEPDLIALTGDFITEGVADFPEVFRALQPLHAPHGIYAVPGNHDHIAGIDRWRQELDESGFIEDLTNRSVMVSVGRATLCIAGVDDLEHGRPSLGALPPPEARDFTLLLAHNPEQADRSRRQLDSIDLIVSGHTHAGQIRVPGLGPIKTIARPRSPFEEGLRRRPWTQVYTSRGIGTIHLPLRFLARPEVTILELTSEARDIW